jgi:hypothetical protein
VFGLDDEELLETQGVACFVLGHHHLVKLLAGTDSDLLDLAVRGNGPRQVGDLHARQDGNEHLAAVHGVNGSEDEFHGLIQGDPEAGHSRVGDGHRPGLPLLAEERDHRTPAPDHVSVPHASEAGAPPSRVGVSLDHDLLGAELGGPVEVHRIHGLVGGEGHDLFHAAVDARIDDVLCAQDVGLDGLEGVVLGGGNLFQRRGVYDKMDAPHGAVDAISIPDVAQQEAQPVIPEFRAHLALFQLVPGEDAEGPERVILHEAPGECPSEGTGASGEKNDLVLEAVLHHASLLVSGESAQF